mmetsp:Transcript_16508/g.33556  ORF Transcript_16508/g.33556 Transcript_16508/m.33556 type:complete len:293 (-) Transcript_16508:1917-2795(-)
MQRGRRFRLGGRRRTDKGSGSRHGRAHTGLAAVVGRSFDGGGARSVRWGRGRHVRGPTAGLGGVVFQFSPIVELPPRSSLFRCCRRRRSIGRPRRGESPPKLGHQRNPQREKAKSPEPIAHRNDRRIRPKAPRFRRHPLGQNAPPFRPRAGTQSSPSQDQHPGQGLRCLLLGNRHRPKGKFLLRNPRGIDLRHDETRRSRTQRLGRLSRERIRRGGTPGRVHGEDEEDEAVAAGDRQEGLDIEFVRAEVERIAVRGDGNIGVFAHRVYPVGVEGEEAVGARSELGGVENVGL